MEFGWDEKKNQELLSEGRPSFQEARDAIRDGNLLDEIPNPLHVGQSILVVKIKGYIHAIPCETRGEKLWLITIYPSRKLNKAYGG